MSPTVDFHIVYITHLRKPEPLSWLVCGLNGFWSSHCTYSSLLNTCPSPRVTCFPNTLPLHRVPRSVWHTLRATGISVQCGSHEGHAYLSGICIIYFLPPLPTTLHKLGNQINLQLCERISGTSAAQVTKELAAVARFNPRHLVSFFLPQTTSGKSFQPGKTFTRETFKTESLFRINAKGSFHDCEIHETRLTITTIT